MDPLCQSSLTINPSLGCSPDCTSTVFFFRYFLGSNNSGHRQEISGTEQSQLMERKKYNNDWHINW